MKIDLQNRKFFFVHVRHGRECLKHCATCVIRPETSVMKSEFVSLGDRGRNNKKKLYPIVVTPFQTLRGHPLCFTCNKIIDGI